jgi:hypothetical protein
MIEQDVEGGVAMIAAAKIVEAELEQRAAIGIIEKFVELPLLEI